MFEDFFKDFFNDTQDESNEITFMEPRELIPFSPGEGALQKCIGEYVEMENNASRRSEQPLKISCSHITMQEEELFNETLFDLLFNKDYLYTPKWGNSRLYLILQEISKDASLTMEEAIEILQGFTAIHIVISNDVKEDYYLSTSLFTDAETGPCFNDETGRYDDEDHFFLLDLNPMFMEACNRVKGRMGRG